MGKKNIVEDLLGKRVSRGKFLKMLFAALAILPFSSAFSNAALADNGAKFNGRKHKGIRGDHDLVAVHGNDPYTMTVKAIDAMGGMERFVRKNDTVLVKPNIGWDRSPEQAGNTNPLVVAALIDLSFKAGAKRVNVFDITCNEPRRCYENSGIEKIAKEHGANVYFPDDWDTVEAHFDFESKMEGWPILKDAIECDTFINVPILKDHGLSRLTVSMKNLMGVCGGNRGQIHRDIGEKLVDLTRFLNPELTVIDAYRVLVRNGPTGGNLADVKMMNTVIAATDATLADTYACSLLGINPDSIPNINAARNAGFGSTNINAADILKIEA